ncbi:MAG: hypothetical protein FWE62_05340, partial [Firmicutes bacterium]|nr:hypothetical protein [Bacillota bacterium]
PSLRAFFARGFILAGIAGGGVMGYLCQAHSSFFILHSSLYIETRTTDKPKIAELLQAGYAGVSCRGGGGELFIRLVL